MGVVENSGGYRAEQQRAEAAATVGGHHDEVNAVPVNELDNGFDWGSTLNRFLNQLAGEVFKREAIERGLAGVVEFVDSGRQVRVGIAIAAHGEFKGMEQCERCFMLPRHREDGGRYGLAPLGKIDRVQNVVKQSHFEPPSWVEIGSSRAILTDPMFSNRNGDGQSGVADYAPPNREKAPHAGCFHLLIIWPRIHADLRGCRGRETE
jgi:hypothetical protein